MNRSELNWPDLWLAARLTTSNYSYLFDYLSNYLPIRICVSHYAWTDSRVLANLSFTTHAKCVFVHLFPGCCMCKFTHTHIHTPTPSLCSTFLCMCVYIYTHVLVCLCVYIYIDGDRELYQRSNEFSFFAGIFLFVGVAVLVISSIFSIGCSRK